MNSLKPRSTQSVTVSRDSPGSVPDLYVPAMAARGDLIYRAFATVRCVLSLPSSFMWRRPTSFIEDCVAFLAIAFSARKRGLVHAAGVPSLLSNIVEGATIYFLVVFASQLLFIFLEFLAPVSDLSADSFSSSHLITATHRNQSRRSQQCKSPPSNISIRLNLTTCSPTHSANTM